MIKLNINWLKKFEDMTTQLSAVFILGLILGLPPLFDSDFNYFPEKSPEYNTIITIPDGTVFKRHLNGRAPNSVSFKINSKHFSADCSDLCYRYKPNDPDLIGRNVHYYILSSDNESAFGIIIHGEFSYKNNKNKIIMHPTEQQINTRIFSYLFWPKVLFIYIPITSFIFFIFALSGYIYLRKKSKTQLNI